MSYRSSRRITTRDEAPRARRSRRNLFMVLGMLLGLAILIPVGSMIVQKRVEATSKAQDSRVLQQEVDALAVRRQELKSRIEYLRTVPGVEEEARRQGMVKKGERAFVVSDLSREPVSQSSPKAARPAPISPDTGPMDRIRVWWKGLTAPAGP